MKNVLLATLITLLVQLGSMAQTANDAIPAELSLRDRYLQMKTKSQTYGDYKVIKENVLDGVWKIYQDTLAAKAVVINNTKAEVQKLTTELNDMAIALKEKEESMEEVLHASTHIAVLGIDVQKGVFITSVAVIIGALTFLVVFVVGRMKLQSASLSEKKLTIDALSHEFDEYKHRAMEKQVKLSRELQNERNKLQDLKTTHR